MITESENCVFNEGGFCVHTDRECSRVCRWSMKRFTDLGDAGFHNHFETYWKRKDRFVDLITRWIAVGISILALSVSALAYVASAQASHAKKGTPLANAPLIRKGQANEHTFSDKSLSALPHCDASRRARHTKEGKKQRKKM